MRKKITWIGAGSVVFAKRMMGDILQFPALQDSHLCLMDIDAERLKVAELTAERVRDTLGVSCQISSTLDRTEAIRGADYVITMIQVGGYKPSTVDDFEIPAKYGLQQTIGDTLGVGGVFRGLRTIPELVKVARDIADVGNPDCLLINYSNPMAMNCWGVDRATGIPHVGLCHSVQGTSQVLASFLDLPYDDISYLVAGINHMAFFLKYEYKGQDLYPLLFRALEDETIYSMEKVRFEMMRRTGYFVTESSEHQSEYVPYFIHHGKAIIDKYSIPIDEYLRRCESIIASWKEEEKKLLGGESGKDFKVDELSHEYGSYIINACETNEQTLIYGNVPNRGEITNLPLGCCIEVPCMVDRNGIQPTHIGALPPQLAGICRTNINVQDLTVEAALTGNREAIYHAVMLDPHTSATLTLDKIWAMCDELIEAHQASGYLGEFRPVIKNTGRAFAGTGDRVLASLEMEKGLDEGEGVLRLKVENPSGTRQKLDVSISLPPLIHSDSSSEITALDVPAGETICREFPIRLEGCLDEDLVIGLSASSPHVLCRDYIIRPRRKLETNDEGWKTCELKLGGELAVEAFFRSEADKLKMRFKVNDSAVEKSSALTSWLGIRTGSGIQVLVAPEPQSELTGVFLLPDPDGEARLVAKDCVTEINEPVSQAITSVDYTVEAEIPFERLKIKPGCKSVLIEICCNLMALGQAHSGGRTTLTGFRNRALQPLMWELNLD